MASGRGISNQPCVCAACLVLLLKLLLSSRKVPFPAGCELLAPADAGLTPPSQTFPHQGLLTCCLVVCVVLTGISSCSCSWRLPVCRCCHGCQRLKAVLTHQTPPRTRASLGSECTLCLEKPSQGKCHPSLHVVLVPWCIFNNIPDLQAVFSMNQAFISCACEPSAIWQNCWCCGDSCDSSNSHLHRENVTFGSSQEGSTMLKQHARLGS